MSLLTKTEYIKIGKNITECNPFFFTLNLLLKYYFVQQQDLYLMSFIKDVTKNENEFKIFIIYKEYALFSYQTILYELFNQTDNVEDITFAIIGYVKLSYDNDRNVLKPFITTITEHENDVIKTFNFIRSEYNFKLDALSKFDKLNKAIEYLEKSKEMEQQAKMYSNMAMEILQDLRGNFKKTIEMKNEDESCKMLTIKNKF